MCGVRGGCGMGAGKRARRYPESHSFLLSAPWILPEVLVPYTSLIKRRTPWKFPGGLFTSPALLTGEEAFSRRANGCVLSVPGNAQAGSSRERDLLGCRCARCVRRLLGKITRMQKCAGAVPRFLLGAPFHWTDETAGCCKSVSSVPSPKLF